MNKTNGLKPISSPETLEWQKEYYQLNKEDIADKRILYYYRNRNKILKSKKEQYQQKKEQRMFELSF